MAEHREGRLRLPQGGERRADPRLVDGPAHQRHEQQRAHEQVVEALAAGEAGRPADGLRIRPTEAALDPEVALEERLLGHVAEGQGGDGEVDAPKAQGEDPEQEGDRDRRHDDDGDDHQERQPGVLEEVDHHEAEAHLGHDGQGELADPAEHRNRQHDHPDDHAVVEGEGGAGPLHVVGHGQHEGGEDRQPDGAQDAAAVDRGPLRGGRRLLRRELTRERRPFHHGAHEDTSRGLMRAPPPCRPAPWCPGRSGPPAPRSG